MHEMYLRMRGKLYFMERSWTIICQNSKNRQLLSKNRQNGAIAKWYNRSEFESVRRLDD